MILEQGREPQEVSFAMTIHVPVLQPEFDLTRHNTMGLRSTAQFAAFIDDVAQIPLLCARAIEMGLPLHILGGGSNSLPRTRVEGITAIMAARGRTTERTPQGWKITAQAGENWSNLVAWTVAEGIGGLENLSGIPGAVGAAPVQNIGAYGIEIADRLETITAFDRLQGSLRRLSSHECAFSYRDSCFKREPNRFVIAMVSLLLPTPWRANLGYAGLDTLSDDESPNVIAAAVLSLRRSKLPDWHVLGNAGSFFHNPIVPRSHPAAALNAPKHAVPGGVKLSAAWLLEACGLKGHRIGGAAFSDRHVLVIVNHKDASLEDIHALAAVAKKRVKQRFDIHLTQEPILLE